MFRKYTPTFGFLFLRSRIRNPYLPPITHTCGRQNRDNTSNLRHFALYFLGFLCVEGGEAEGRKMEKNHKRRKKLIGGGGPRSLLNVTKKDILIFRNYVICVLYE